MRFRAPLFPSTLALFFVFASAIPVAGDSGPTMNGISLLQFGDFTKKWPLVTIRYRDDSGEIRLIYANEIAYATLKKGSYPFPDGSVLGKVAVSTGKDPAFPSSKIPSRSRRFQLMVKDRAKYKDTDGWGYGLYNSDGKLFEKDVKQETAACHACHKIVPERDFVFAEIYPFSPLTTLTHKSDPSTKTPAFEKWEAKVAKEPLKSTLAKYRIDRLQVLTGAIRKHFFGGTLDEITPVLIQAAVATGEVSAFVSEDHRTFKLVRPSKSDSCPVSGETAFEVVESRQGFEPGAEIKRLVVCSKP